MYEMYELNNEFIKEKIMDLKEIVRRDVAAGIYDKWYRYNHKDGGEKYNTLWMEEYRKNPPELKIMFVEMDHTYCF